MADFDSPIAMEALRATRVLHAADQEPFPAPGRIRVITIANQKGGVGKTTSTVNLGVALALYGLRTLVIDLDPQGNTSTALGVEHTVGTPSSTTPWSATARWRRWSTRPPPARTAAACRRRSTSPAPRSSWSPSSPASTGCAGPSRPTSTALPPEQRPHYVLIDCPPSLGLLTLNALVAGDEVLIPIQCEYYALEGLGQLLNNIDLVRQHLNPGIAVRTILLTMYDGRTKLADQVADEVRTHFGDAGAARGHPPQRARLRGPGLRPVGADVRPRLARLDQLRRGRPGARRARAADAAARPPGTTAASPSRSAGGRPDLGSRRRADVQVAGRASEHAPPRGRP